ncbi:UNKNOWN [Stylonychia lemnae]|uniref:Uncharacterized protein n=1 Tax=Stylonychia lemnae TaxID=5949 RepID=A0A078BAH8_STYLE|nr:UNKNOWN [Stylonychia lemnae]|eukprot:CDW90563.1 UNKNOWN [Stylonychia lemnae]
MDSERSNFTQESYSPPESQRDQNINLHQQQSDQYLSQPLNIEDLTQRLEVISSLKEKQNSEMIQRHNNSQQQEERDISPPTNMNSDNFTLMHNSPGKESLLYSFQGLQTSNFPTNLQVSSLLKLREPLQNEVYHQHKDSLGANQQQYQNPASDENESENQNNIMQDIGSEESKKTSAFNGSFYKFEGQKIKEFEKSIIIKFEEFEGGDSQTESDPNRKYSERISDRIYERQDFGQNSKHMQSYEDNQQIVDSQSSGRQQTYQDSPYSKERQLPLFIITEEDQSEIHSSYQTYQKIQSMNSSNIERQINQVNIGNAEFLRIHSGDSAQYQQQHQQYFIPASRDQTQNQIYQKSKSQPIAPKKNSIKGGSTRNSYGDSKNENRIDKVFNTDTSPIGGVKITNKKQFSPNFKDEQKGRQYAQSRISNESPRVFNNEQDQISHYFYQRMQSNAGIKSQNPNNSQPDFAMSDEDLLSNIDRVSKILPTNEISEDEYQQPLQKFEEINFAQKLREQKQIIDHLKCENQNKQQLIHIKESQLSFIQHKNEQLEYQILELSDQLKNTGSKSIYSQKQQQDMATQITEEEFQVTSEKKKIRPKKGKQSLSGLKKTPQRSFNDPNLIESHTMSGHGNLMSKQNSTTNVFDTPQVRLDNMLRESPSSNPKNQPALQKHSSISYNTEDLNHFKQQIVLIKQQLQRSEENNLTLQLKIEKQKNDKEKQKEKILQLSIEKNDLQKQVEQYTVEVDNFFKKAEAMKVEIAEYERMVFNLEKKSNTQIVQVDRDIQVFFKARKSDQSIQVEFNQVKSPKKNLPVNEEKDIQVNTFDEKEYQNLTSNFSSHQQIVSQSHLNRNITIINNRNDLNQLLGKAKDYEQISLQLQHEINEHRKMLRENQERAQRSQQEHQDYKRRLKKRDGKILKLKTYNQKLERELKEVRQKVIDYQNKLQDAKLKMEGKIQEREFKLISLKNQMKQLVNYNQQKSQKPSGNSGIMTPNMQGSQSKIITQEDLFHMINQIIQRQISDQDNQSMISRRFESLVKNRAKSQDNQQINVMGFNENDNDTPLNGLYEEPRIVNKNSQNVIYTGQGENPSFSNNGNLDLFQTSMKNENYQSPTLIPTSQQIPVDSIQDKMRKSFNNSQREDNSHEFQKIFNSSLKRINQELENIKEVSQNPQQALQIERQKLILSNNNHRLPKKPVNYNQIKAKSQNLIYNYVPDEFVKKDLTYEDSLQSHFIERDTMQNHILHIENQDSQSDMSHALLEQLKMLEKRRADSSEQQDTYDRRSVENQRRNGSSMQNTQTFRKPQSFAVHANPQNLKLPQKSMYQEYQLFNNTQGTLEKEQNVSIFYDFKPAFENSNISNNSKNDISNSRSYLKNPKIEVNQYDSNPNSIVNSFRVPATTMASQIKLHSNLLQRDKNLANLSNSEKSEQIDYNDISNDSITHRLQSYGKKSLMTPQSQISQYVRAQASTQRQSNADGIVSQRKEPPSDYKLSNHIRYEDMRGRYNNNHVNNKSYVSDQSNPNMQNILNHIKQDTNISNLRNIQVSNQQFLANLHSSQTQEGSKSTLSNYSQKLEDLRKRYGRIN